jgi:hypothetical protein
LNTEPGERQACVARLYCDLSSSTPLAIASTLPRWWY